MTKRALKRRVREGESAHDERYDDAKVRRLPINGWSPLGANDEQRDQGDG